MDHKRPVLGGSVRFPHYLVWPNHHFQPVTNLKKLGTSQWAVLTPVMKGSLHVVRVTPGLNGKVGDGVGFPAVVPWSVGTAWENVELDFGVPTLLEFRELYKHVQCAPSSDFT
ncbi:uncharacterized protein LACBIDRAFT_325370 [Laccaria bicolor S238N-H82]|uniref:Predicted protein n=1 Tax=Laccaria bicolor (strain S238N-H82 / ATCC MYA-4686) TaxID=486041 RepID=B0D4Q3_LACBS|nr:uncharacterized protein LACBIDRAFT_325370 [Laccaria bicolor S238N-H82]EDR10384.1 predicted protein [Laccaria bicolor S238N-H82]|eukprot:XP_001878834.1 predicted protein [Laccaria bicolor S238N-H82]